MRFGDIKVGMVLKVVRDGTSELNNGTIGIILREEWNPIRKEFMKMLKILKRVNEFTCDPLAIYKDDVVREITEKEKDKLMVHLL